MEELDGQPGAMIQGAGEAAQGEQPVTIRRLLDIDADMRSMFGTNLLSHEFRLILQATANKELIVKDACASSLLSGRAFHGLVKRLEAVGILQCKQNQHDRRSKSIEVNADVADGICRRLPDWNETSPGS